MAGKPKPPPGPGDPNWDWYNYIAPVVSEPLPQAQDEADAGDGGTQDLGDFSHWTAEELSALRVGRIGCG